MCGAGRPALAQGGLQGLIHGSVLLFRHTFLHIFLSALKAALLEPCTDTHMHLSCSDRPEPRKIRCANSAPGFAMRMLQTTHRVCSGIAGHMASIDSHSNNIQAAEAKRQTV